MRPLCLLPLLASTCFAAGEAAGPKKESPPPPPPPRIAAIERMLSERESPEAFAKAVAEAKKQGVSEQGMLEARFLFAVDRRDDDGIAAMLPEFLARKDTFKLADSEIFAVTEDWLAVVEYVQAIAALKKGDRDGFKRHITEAYWLSPRQGAAFASHIERLRMAEAMRAVRFDFNTGLPSLTGGGEVKLADVLGGRKALLLHFWSPWSRECEETLPDFAATARELEGKGVAVVSILAEDSPEIQEQARASSAKLGGKPPGAWLVDDAEEPLLRLLRVQSLPIMVLVSPEGRVLFNGHPAQGELWDELVKLSPGIKRPALGEEEHGHGHGH